MSSISSNSSISFKYLPSFETTLAIISMFALDLLSQLATMMNLQNCANLRTCGCRVSCKSRFNAMFKVCKYPIFKASSKS
ncbi:hypothetical protein WICPIJ_002044 [Wickerhamomyces pijperi]|uniref:Uncharacterized protein n=1 Tax=Wickerhamomyces pijperi TaxID=599730 RepID=A0A9P8TQ64_WICPI|nr:hypothetical protein WICPIJ_002044 [Wickerhamomyces pijperi]